MVSEENFQCPYPQPLTELLISTRFSERLLNEENIGKMVNEQIFCITRVYNLFDDNVRCDCSRSIFRFELNGIFR